MSRLTRQEAVRLNLAEIQDAAVGHILERHAYDLTVCPTCEQAGFVHANGCELAAEVEELAPKVIGKTPSVGADLLGPLIYLTGPLE